MKLMTVSPRHSGAPHSGEPGIHQAACDGGEMDSGFALRAPWNDRVNF